jgi:hypothetical protein
MVATLLRASRSWQERPVGLFDAWASSLGSGYLYRILNAIGSPTPWTRGHRKYLLDLDLQSVRVGFPLSRAVEHSSVVGTRILKGTNRPTSRSSSQPI